MRNGLRAAGVLAAIAALALGFLRPTATTAVIGDSLAGSVTWGCPSPVGKWTGISSSYSIESHTLSEAPLVAPGTSIGGLFQAFLPTKACRDKTAARQHVVLGVGLLGLILIAATFIRPSRRPDGGGAEL